MFNQIDHIGIAVRSIDAAAALYGGLLGMTHVGDDVVEEQGVRVAFYQLGEVKIELLEPLHDASPVARFIAKRGEGVHHVALRTDDVVASGEDMKEGGLRLLYDAPRDGAHGKLINFMHPKDTGGVLLEMVQRHKEGS